MNNTLKQLQEKGEEILEQFDEYFGNLPDTKYMNIDPKYLKSYFLKVIEEQTTLAYNAGKADMLDTVLKEIDEHETNWDANSKEHTLMREGYYLALDTLKNRLLDNKE